jgi:hypothetical protein
VGWAEASWGRASKADPRAHFIIFMFARNMTGGGELRILVDEKATGVY